MDKLIAGYRRFRAAQWPERRETFERLAEQGQSPRALVLACCDSRVDPGMIFAAGPGELFIVRNIANLVPPYTPDGAARSTSAAVEFGVRVLRVPDLIVLGHAMCGGVRALLHGVPEPAEDFLAEWIRIAEPAKRRILACSPADPETACELETVKLALENLRTFPWIAERERAGKLRLHGATFDVRSGVLSWLGSDGAFRPV